MLEKPTYGVQCYFEDTETNVDLVRIARQEDRIDIVETGYEHIRSIQNTYAQQNKAVNQESDVVQFNDDLGLACQSLPEGVTIDKLWKIV